MTETDVFGLMLVILDGIGMLAVMRAFVIAIVAISLFKFMVSRGS